MRWTLRARVLADSHRYPDGAAYNLRAKLAKKHGVGMDEILLGAAPTSCSTWSCASSARRQQHIVFAEPAFVVYRIAALACGVPFTAVPLTAGFVHDLPAMAAAVTPQTRVMFVANPNNPTGTHVGRAAVEKLLREVPPEVIIVMDEAYFEYADAPDYPDSLRAARSARTAAGAAHFFEDLRAGGVPRRLRRRAAPAHRLHESRARARST